MKILFLDSRQEHRDYSLLLQSHENHITVVNDGARALRALQKSMFDLIILDLVSTIVSSIDVLHWIRNNLGKRVPVLVLSSDSTNYSSASVLNAGADDCIRMPVSMDEFVARVNAITRRASASEDLNNAILIGEYVVPRGGQNIFINGEPVRLTRKEFDITAILFRNVGCVVPRGYLIAHVWGSETDTASRSLDTHVYRTRNKLRLSGAHGLLLQAIYTIGYRLDRI